MPVKVGSIVHIVGFDPHGYFVEEYLLVGIAADHIALKHLATDRNGSRLAGSQLVVEKSLQHLAEFDIPLDDRLRKFHDEIELLAQFPHS